MSPFRKLAIYLGLGLAYTGVIFYLGAGHGQRAASAKAATAQTQSDQHEGIAKSLAVQATAKDQQAAANQAAVNDADARVASAKRDLARLKAALLVKGPVSLAQPEAGPDRPARPLEGVEPLQAVVTQQDTVIKAQDQEIAALKLQVSIEHAAAVQWHQAYDESQRALAMQKIASDAAVHAEHSHGVRAQLVRGLEGLALGYAAGRLQR